MGLRAVLEVFFSFVDGFDCHALSCTAIQVNSKFQDVKMKKCPLHYNGVFSFVTFYLFTFAFETNALSMCHASAFLTSIVPLIMASDKDMSRSI